MKEICDCGDKAMVAKPLKYSQQDRLANYRRIAKHNEYINRGFL